MPEEIKQEQEKKPDPEPPKVTIERGLWRISFRTGKMEKIE